MNKSGIVSDFRNQLSAQYQRILSGLKEATEAATGDDTKAESKYDTRGLEASYLAAGQAEQADELAEARPSRFSKHSSFLILTSTIPLLQVPLSKRTAAAKARGFYSPPSGGGLTCETKDGIVITALGPSAPLREKLLGSVAGESIDGISVLEVNVINSTKDRQAHLLPSGSRDSDRGACLSTIRRL